MGTNYIYKEQQKALKEIAARLGVVYFRPSYHAKSGDANTVLLYTKEDAAHNRLVDRQDTQYSRSQAVDLMRAWKQKIDEKYIFRDYFWCFHNHDVNGCYDLGYANYGRLDLRGMRWKEILEGHIRLALAKKRLNDYFEAAGGYFFEVDETLNDLNRDIIKAVKIAHGKAFLGRINLPTWMAKPDDTGSQEVYEEFDGNLVRNHACDFCVPVKDEKLEVMIRFWRSDECEDRVKLVEKIWERVRYLGGENFTWR